MAKKFKLKSRASSEATKKANSKGGGGKNFKIKKKVSRLLILPPVEEDAAIFETTYDHTLWGNGKPLASCSSPFANDEEDKIHSLGWDVQKKYKDSKDQKLKSFYQNLLVNEKNVINVLDLDDLEAGAQKWPMPKSVSEVVMQEFADVEDDDFTDIADLDEGRPLQITTNGESGNKIRYKVVKFLKKGASLLEDGELDEDQVAEIIENMPNLKKEQKKWDEDEFENFLKKVTKEGEKIGIDWDDLDSDVEEEEEEDDEYEAEEGDNDSEFEIDEDEEFDDEEFEEEEEEEEPVRKKKAVKKKVAKKRRR